MTRNARPEALSFWSSLQAEHKRYQEAARVLPTSQAKVQEDMRRYLCLRCAGFLEQVTFVIIHSYLEQKGGGPPLAFAQSWFERAPNLNVNAFVKLIGRFGPQHEAALQSFLTPLRRQSLGDLLEIRNDVAHGLHFAGQRLDPSRYITLCEEIYEWLVDTFLGESIAVLDASGVQVERYENTPS